jgi:predicted dithiol-disulfide oxidoreductase (DUF899 family)
MARSIQIDGVQRELVSREDWQRAHAALLEREKALTRAQDQLAAERRRAPWLRLERSYAFQGPAGKAELADLFDGRRQLIVYHHMLQPADPDPCSGCGMVGDQIPHLSHLRQRDTSLVFVSRAPIAEIEGFRRRMGWEIPWFETADGFNADLDVTDGFGLNVLYRAREGGEIYRTYSTTGRGVETLGTIWALLDRTPLGRQENWEDAPAGTPQSEPYQWWRLHDEYGSHAPSCCGAE